jgi:2'-5' RNA ligase
VTGDTLRLFFALWPTAAVRMDLGSAAAALPLAAPARRVPAVNHHLTVAFIGEVAATRLDALRAIGRAVRAPRCEISLDCYEYWPKPECIVALARTVPPALQSLWDELHGALAAAGFALRAKKLRPHVTLVRHCSAAPAWPPLAPIEWPADALCLVRSETQADIPVYTVLDTWPLLDKPPSH